MPGAETRRTPRVIGGVGAGLAVALVALSSACSAPEAGERREGRYAAVPDRQAALSPAARLPSTEGLDTVLMAEALEVAASMPRLRTLLVARHGELLVERRFRGPALDAPANVKSVSKSVLSALVGIAIAERRLDGVDEPIARFFDSYLAADSDPRKAAITVENLLTMQSGLESTSGARYGRWVASRDWVRYALTRPMVADPGGRRLYSTGNSHLLSAILTQATEQSTWAYARGSLFEPLGESLPRWPADPQGIYFGGNEMRMTPRAMLRFGELYRNGGRHEGRQLVPEAWVRESLTPRTGARRPGEAYGYGWFVGQVRGHPMFYAWGYGGQFIFVVPELELTVVTTSDHDVAREREHLIGIRRLFDDWIVPAARAGAAPARPGRAAVDPVDAAARPSG